VSNNHPREADPAERADNLVHDIDEIRGHLDGLFDELDHRRHELFDIRLQLRRHTTAVIVTVVAVAGIVGGVIALAVRRRRRRSTLRARLARLRTAVSRMIDDPDRVAKETPNPGLKILTAGGTAVASILGKRVGGRLLHR